MQKRYQVIGTSKRTGRVIECDTFYTRAAAQDIVDYGNRPSRITGRTGPIHWEVKDLQHGMRFPV